MNSCPDEASCVKRQKCEQKRPPRLVRGPRWSADGRKFGRIFFHFPSKSTQIRYQKWLAFSYNIAENMNKRQKKPKNYLLSHF